MYGSLELTITQSIVLGASRDSAKRHIYAFMPLCRFLLADRLAPEALRPLASQLLFGDPLRGIRSRTRNPQPGIERGVKAHKDSRRGTSLRTSVVVIAVLNNTSTYINPRYWA
jgi:hypothetical protein